MTERDYLSRLAAALGLGPDQVRAIEGGLAPT
jgi:uncharacterized membrane protein YebE (DUF533 family)